MSDPHRGVARMSARVQLESSPRVRRASSRHFDLYLELFGSDAECESESNPPFRSYGSLWEALTSDVAPHPQDDGGRGAERCVGSDASPGWRDAIKAFPEVFLGRGRRERSHKVHLEKALLY